MIHVFVPLTVLTEPLVPFVRFVRHEPSTRRASPLTLTYGIFVHCALLVIVVACAASKMPVALGAGDSKVGERARRASHAVATRLVTDVRDVPCTCFVARFTYVLLSHCPSKVGDHMIVSFEDIVQ